MKIRRFTWRRTTQPILVMIPIASLIPMTNMTNSVLILKDMVID